jgi:hypothetical protein
MRLGELIGKAIHEACHRQKENCSSDSDRHQPGSTLGADPPLLQPLC